jgi:uncharacterized membrane protein
MNWAKRIKLFLLTSTLLFLLSAMIVQNAVPVNAVLIVQKVNLTDTLKTDLSVDENIYVLVQNNGTKTFSITPPANAKSVTLNGLVLNHTPGDPVIIELNCTNCTFILSYSVAAVSKKIGNKTYEFSRTLNLPLEPKQIYYSIILPEGYIVDMTNNANIGSEELSIVPAPTSIETNGKQVKISWIENTPTLPKVYFVKYHDYESLDEGNSLKNELSEKIVIYLIIAMLLIGFALGFLIFYFVARKNEKQNKLQNKTRVIHVVPSSLLSPDEKKAVDVLRTNKEISQKEVCKTLGWSKSKASAVMTTLEYKKLISREKIGRNYKIQLIKDVEK